MSKHQPPDGGLPTATSEFIGRQAEVHRINTLLSGTTRLLTLVGPGGIGKTRLAAEALRRHRTPRPIHWTRLARLARAADAANVAEEIAQSVAQSDTPGRSAWAILVDTLTAADAPVLILDNCEHVTTGTGTLIADLLDTVPTLTILATSREPVGWVDERILTVPPLPPGQALELLRRRAELTGRPIAEDAEQTHIAEQICRRVDHNPLFIRLAAARLLHKPPAAVLRELTGDADDSRLRWPDHAVGVEERHRGVSDVIAWSYQLCGPEEQLLLDRMSVFAAGFEPDAGESHGRGAELAAIVAVCADESLPPDQIGHTLERLVDRSLVFANITTTTVRYYLPESVRVFAQSRLRQRTTAGVHEAARLSGLHRRYYRDNVVAGQLVWNRPEEVDWLNWLRPAWDNLLTAIETSLTEPAEAVIGLEIATTLSSLRVPLVQNASRTMAQHAERALEATADAEPPPTRLRITAMAVIAWIMLWQGRIGYANQLLDECVALSIPDADRRRGWRDKPEVDLGLPAIVEFAWGLDLGLVRLDSRSAIVLARAREKFEESGDYPGAVRTESYEISALINYGHPEEALARAKSYLDRHVIPGAEWTASWAELPWVLALATHGDPRESIALGRAALVRRLAAGDRWSASMLLGYRVNALVRILSERIASGNANKPELTEIATEIAHVVGGLATLRASIGIGKVPVFSLFNDVASAAGKFVLGDAAYAAAEMRGAQLRPEFDEVQRYALGTLTIDNVPIADVATPAVPSRWNELSRAEREVALLAAAGWTNRAIAVRRGSSIRTVDAQVASIRQKLLITSRADIAAHVPDELASQVRTEAEHLFGRTG